MLPFMIVITFVPGGSRAVAPTTACVLWLVGCDCDAIISSLLLSVRTVPFLPIVPLISSLLPPVGTCTIVVAAAVDVGMDGAIVAALYIDLAIVPTTVVVLAAPVLLLLVLLLL